MKKYILKTKFDSPDSQFSSNDILTLMNLYLDEWKYLSDALWQRSIKCFYANLVVLFLPYISSFLKITLPNFDYYILTTWSAAMSLVFIAVTFWYIKRIKVCSDAYQSLNNSLPVKMRKQSLKTQTPCYHPNEFVCLIMFISLAILSGFMFLTYYSQSTSVV